MSKQHYMKLATLCYVQREGQTLMLHRVKKKNDMHQGKWSGLGGKLESGESPEECAIREVEEESGLRCRNSRLRGVITFPVFDGINDWYTFLFTMHDFNGELIDSAEGVLEWIDNSRLLDLNLWPGDRIFMPWLFQDRFFSAKFIYEKGEFKRYTVTFYGPDGKMQTQQTEAQTLPSAAGPDSFQPIYTPQDDTYCWMCGAAVDKRHCKIVCLQCGFTRDCSDP
jgi:8-oxo-dGTP diphosphatase